MQNVIEPEKVVERIQSGDESYTNVNLNAHATAAEGGGPAEAAVDATAIAVANAIKAAGDSCKVEELHMSAVCNTFFRCKINLFISFFVVEKVTLKKIILFFVFIFSCSCFNLHFFFLKKGKC
jgi:hypothetical protein